MRKTTKRTKRSIVESAELTQALMHCPGLGFYIVQDGRFIYASPLFQKLTGYTEEELRNIHPLDLVHPEDRELVRERAIESLKGHSVLPYEYRFIKKNGEMMWNLERLASIEYMGKRAAVGSFMDVTDSKRVEEALAKSEERYRTVLEGMGDSYYEVDLAGNFTFFNDALCRHLGYPREELIGMNYKVYTPPEHVERVFQIYTEVYRKGEPTHVEMEEIRKDGSRLFAENSVMPLRNEKGEIIGFSGIGHDVTERKQAEEVLRQSENKYRTLVDNASDAIMVVQDDVIKFCNDRSLELSGYSREELASVPFLDFIHPEDLQKAAELYVAGLSEGAPMQFHNLRFIHKTGDVRWADFALAPITWEGKPAILCIALDITGRKEAEEALRRSEQDFRDSIENSPFGIRIIDKEGKTLYANWALLDMWGYNSVEELEAVPKEQCYTPQSYAEDMERLGRMKRGERAPVGYELSIVRSDGQVRHVSVSRVNLLWGGEDCFQLVYQDITERKEVEEALRQSENKHRMLIDNISDAIIVAQDNTVKFFNDKALEISGYSREELASVPFWNFIHPEDMQKAAERYLEGLSDSAAAQFYDLRFIHKTGDVRWVDIALATITWEGRPATMALVSDVTERKRAGEAIRRSEQNFRDSIENSPLGIRILDNDGKTLYANRALLDMWGYNSVEELETVPKEQRYTPETYAEHLERLEKRKRGEPAPLSYETSIVRSDGQIRILSVSRGELLWNGEQQFQIVSQDITERKRAEEFLRRSEQNFRDSIENSPLGMHVIDKDGKHLYTNRALLDIWGYSSIEELEAVPREQRYTPQSYKEHIERLAKRSRRGEPAPTTYEISIVRSDGQIRHLSVSRGELIWNGEKQFQVVYQDVTERKRAEQALADEAMRRRILMDQSRDGICILDEDSKVVETNPRFAEMLGYSLEEVRELHTWDWDPQFTREELLEMGHNVDAAGIRIETHHRRKDGMVFDVDVSVNSVVVGGKKLLYCVSRDITERKKAEEALAKSEERYRNILAEIQEGYYETDLAGNFTFVNDATCRLLGHPREEIIGTSYKAYVPKEEVKGVYKAWNKVYRTGRPVQSYPFTVIRKDKKQTFLESSVSPLRNKEGKTIGFRSISRDVTERAQFERKLAEMATHDALTGLPNRTLLSDRYTVALALSRRSRSRLAVLMLDLDRFKAVNDSMGHDVGDKLLKAVGKRLKATVRKSDTVARIGGDEFVLLLPQIPHEEEAVKFSQRILDAFREPFVFDDQRINITTSIGITIYPEGGKDIEGLLKSADTAMYWAKEQGRDIYRLYDGSEAATLLAKRRTTAEA